MQIDFLYENFLPIFLAMLIFVIIAVLMLLRVWTLKITDSIFEFAENTLVIKKVTKGTGKTLKIGESRVVAQYSPYLLKQGISTKRVYLLEEEAKETTDLYSRIIKMEDKRQVEEKAQDAMKGTIIESSVIDKMLRVFGKLGFSWGNFLFGIMTGLVIALMMMNFGVLK